MRSRAQQPILQVLPKTIVDGQRNNQRSHARGHAHHGNHGHQAHYSLAPFGAKIASGDEEFKTHKGCPLPAFGVTHCKLDYRACSQTQNMHFCHSERSEESL